MIPRPYRIYEGHDEFNMIEMHNPEINRYVSLVHNSETGWISPANDHLTRPDFKAAGSTW